MICQRGAVVIECRGMKTLILYVSKSGNTKAYAEAIADALGTTAYPLKSVKPKKWADYDTIVFGGWVMGGKIQGLDRFLQNWDLISDKNVIVFANGMGYPDAQTRKDLITGNLLDLYHLRFYQLRGSFDFSKVKFPYSFLLNVTMQRMASDPTQAATLEVLKQAKENPIVYFDQEKIDYIVSVIRNLPVTVEAKDKE